MYITFKEFKTACKYHDDEDEYDHPVCILPLEDAGYQYNEEDVACEEKNCSFVKTDQMPKNDKEEYLIQYECYNCKTRFAKSIPMGRLAEGRGGKCPYCGIEDQENYEIGWSHKVLRFYTPGEEYKHGEILP